MLGLRDQLINLGSGQEFLSLSRFVIFCFVLFNFDSFRFEKAHVSGHSRMLTIVDEVVKALTVPIVDGLVAFSEILFVHFMLNIMPFVPRLVLFFLLVQLLLQPWARLVGERGGIDWLLEDRDVDALVM